MKINLVGKVVYGLILAGLGLVAIFMGIPELNFPGGYKLFTVRSGSMRPRIPTGSLVVVRPAADYRVGEVITFKPALMPITHRLQNISGGLYTTKGDANDAPDPEPARREQILGKVVFVAPYIGWPMIWAKSKEGFLMLVVIPATLIIYSEVLTIKTEIKKIKQQQ